MIVIRTLELEIQPYQEAKAMAVDASHSQIVSSGVVIEYAWS